MVKRVISKYRKVENVTENTWSFIVIAYNYPYDVCCRVFFAGKRNKSDEAGEKYLYGGSPSRFFRSGS
jgi:hypothetical protein